MSSKRLKERVPSARYVTTATLVEHELRFHKEGIDGSAKCDAYFTGDENHQIIGVVFEIAEVEKPDLDRKEDLGRGYDEKVVNLVSHKGEQIEATTYFAIKIDASMKPYHWYKQHVIIGAEEFCLPEEYIEVIRNIESITDTQLDRHARELTIYVARED